MEKKKIPQKRILARILAEEVELKDVVVSGGSLTGTLEPSKPSGMDITSTGSDGDSV